jgi:hypothetical protein
MRSSQDHICASFYGCAENEIIGREKSAPAIPRRWSFGTVRLDEHKPERTQKGFTGQPATC